ncbi:MAG: hypothetical protein JWO44_2772 [Bacteroidetes bacterium]|nr:hypothetical protein [Bacteroidota bacterium]
MENLFTVLNKRLNAICIEEGNILKREKKSIELCITILTELKARVIKKGFASKEEEIDFFKNIKPGFESQLKYHAALFELERLKPHGSIAAKRSYFEKKLKEIHNKVQTDLEFYTYYKTGSMHFDDLFFTRCLSNFQLAIQHSVFDVDMNFRTSHDNKVAEILANEQLIKYIETELDKLETIPPAEVKSVQNSKQQLKWTDSKVALIELIYALHSSGSLNKGVLDLKELVLALSLLLNVELGDFYRTWAEIKIRKEPTRYLDSLKVNLENRIMVDMQ